MYDNGYDAEHDSPIFTSEQVLQVKFRDNDEDVLKQVCIRFNSFEKKIHGKKNQRVHEQNSKEINIRSVLKNTQSFQIRVRLISKYKKTG